MKIYTKGTALATAAVLALATAAPALADHDTTGVALSDDGQIIYMDCGQFGGFKNALDEHVEFASDTKGPVNEEGEGRDRAGLNDKLSYAHNKLHEDPPKPCDAAQKIEDFNSKVDQLVAANTDTKWKIRDKQDSDGAIQCLIDGSAAYAEELRLLDPNNCTADSTDTGDKPPRGKGPK